MADANLNVLLIEDDPSYVRLLQRVLAEEFARRGESFPFTFSWSDTLQSGLAALKRGGVDVALVDLSLPDETGFAIFAAVAAAAPDLPLIVLTGFDDEELGAKVVQEGAQDYLVKTHVNGYLLRRAIRHAIERKKVSAEREHLLHELQSAMARIKALQGILKICSHCKRIRDDAGSWHLLEQYVTEHSTAEFSHSVCPDCRSEHYGKK
jgi:DNA-binding NtrC family response regulator